ncbi:MAG: hypothetical protein IPM29_03190 [Planctomycetes bacterium]|nr:hypothetical protein [Planctomycetota bacterium]
MFHDCEFTSSRRIENAIVVLADCRIGGTVFMRPSLEIVGGATTVTGSRIDLAPSLPFPGQSAIRSSGRPRLTGATAVTAAPMWPQPPTVYVASGTLVIDPSTTIQSPTGNPITGPRTVLRQPVPWLDVARHTAGQLIRVTMNSEPHSFVLVLVSVPVVPASVLGELLWTTYDAPVLFGGSADGTGQLTARSGVPAGLRDVPLVVQGLSLSLAGALRIGPATPLIFD